MSRPTASADRRRHRRRRSRRRSDADEPLPRDDAESVIARYPQAALGAAADAAPRAERGGLRQPGAASSCCAESSA